MKIVSQQILKEQKSNGKYKLKILTIAFAVARQRIPKERIIRWLDK